MLLTTRKKGDVISVKLVSGEEIFGRFVSQTADVLKMAKVMKLVIASNGNSGFTSVLQTSSQEELEFNRNHCLLIAVTADEIKKDYLEATSELKVVTPIIQP